jgi:glycosidase
VKVKQVLKEFVFIGSGDSVQSVHIGVFPSRGRYFRSRMRRRDECVFVAELEVPAGDVFYHFFVNENFAEPTTDGQGNGAATSDPLRRCHENLSTEPFAPIRFDGGPILNRAAEGSSLFGAVSYQRWVEAVSVVTVFGCEHPFALSYAYRNKKYWRCAVGADALENGFYLKFSGGETEAYYGKNGLSSEPPSPNGCFPLCDPQTIGAEPVVSSGAVGYQIFPDRFFRPTCAPPVPGHSPWGESPGHYTMAGGTLGGIRQKLDYVRDLGVDFLYLNPIFQAPSNHRYDAADYYRVDPILGTNREFGDLVAEAHSRGLGVILDLAFNHCGTGFFAFADLLRRQERSVYRHWFHVRGFPVEERENPSYDCWHGYKHLPEFNLQNRDVRKYLLDVARYWIREFDVDGYRLDVCSALPPDFVDEIASAVRALKSGAVMVGEYWHEHTGDLLKNGGVNGVTNYPLYWNVLMPLFCRDTVQLRHCADRMMALCHNDPPGSVYGHWNFLSNHDIPRFVSTMRRREMWKLALVLLYVFPGIPMMYYGEESGLEGLDDPDNRRCMPWDALERSADFAATFKVLNRLRTQYRPLFATGDFSIPLVDDEEKRMIVMRTTGDRRLLAVFNFSENPWDMTADTLPLSGLWWMFPHEKPVGDCLRIDGFSPAILLDFREGGSNG